MRFLPPHPNQVDGETGLINKSNGQSGKQLGIVLTSDTYQVEYLDQNGANRNDVLLS